MAPKTTDVRLFISNNLVRKHFGFEGKSLYKIMDPEMNDVRCIIICSVNIWEVLGETLLMIMSPKGNSSDL